MANMEAEDLEKPLQESGESWRWFGSGDGHREEHAGEVELMRLAGGLSRGYTRRMRMTLGF